MTDRYEGIRKALAMGPTPGPWKWEEGQSIITREWDGKEWPIASVECSRLGWHENKRCAGLEAGANAALAAACDPDTIQALLDECDALRAEVAEWKSVAVAQSTEIERLRAEVSELRAARIAYASEFPEAKDGGPDTGNIHTNIRSLKARAERLAEAVVRADLQIGDGHIEAARITLHDAMDAAIIKTYAMPES